MRQPNQCNTNGICKKPTLFFLDWDDTILCSSYLQKANIEPFNGTIPAHVQEELAILEDRVIELLTIAQQSPDVSVAIVTNSTKGWVESTAYHLMPSVFALLDDVTIVSARNMYEARYPMNPSLWKYCAFCAIIKGLNTTSCQVLSLGDSEDERVAALALSNPKSPIPVTLPEITVKSIKLAAQSSPKDLCGQLGKVCANLSTLLSEDMPLDLRMA
ncbi:protein kinase [Carpediemonas membranifera]|uniref:Protein kinase n=1 Tax=Carpediemonas membranifera TaxID=201153 RepID=A0A8J6AX10_9EUKA|nr:protein kinase [Carpediemonas membranifera]|eukprot:KAG9390438.1 protein kinase [Carpediemonas membranifera]